MSCCWDIICLDCKDPHGFENANHQEQAMGLAIKHRATFEALATVLEDLGDLRVCLNWDRMNVFPRWFAKHAGHRLAAIDEYGRTSADCCERFACPSCDYVHDCHLAKGHEGPHSRRRA